MRPAHLLRFVLLVLIFPTSLFAQADRPGFSDSPLAIEVTPTYSLPLLGDSTYYAYGPGGDISLRYKMPFLRWLVGGLNGGYTYSAIKSAPSQPADSLSSIHAGAAVGLAFEPLRNLALEVDLVGGYWYGFLNTPVANQASSGSNPYLAASLRLSYVLVPWLAIGLESSYRNFLGNLQDVTVGVSFSYLVQTRQPVIVSPGGPSPLKSLTITDVNLNGVFPVFYKYYDDHPLGRITLRNAGPTTIDDIKITFLVKEYMENPKVCAQLKRLDPGKQVEVPIYGLFTDKILENAESTKISALISVESTETGTPHRNESIETVRLYDRNAMTWDDDRKAAAFVSAKDPTARKFAGFVAGLAREGNIRALDKNLLVALCVHEALDQYGVNYVVDPNSAFTDFSVNTSAVDYLQFPNQTLNNKGGDCDDLSILNSALLESLGIETAFITIPGHIYIAFALDLRPDDVKKRLSSVDDLIFLEGKTWLPVEVTSIHEGFLSAWQMGAREWRQYNREGKARLVPMHAAWDVYEPVGFSGKEIDMVLPERARLQPALQKQIDLYINREMSPREADLRNQIASAPNDQNLLNRLGLLYAEFGKYDKAVIQFQVILKKREYWPALVNMGNVSLLQKDYKGALSYFDRAAAQSPDKNTVLLGQARASYELGDFAKTDRTYTRLKTLYPDFARDFAFLGAATRDTTRAGEAGHAPVAWGEE